MGRSGPAQGAGLVVLVHAISYLPSQAPSGNMDQCGLGPAILLAYLQVDPLHSLGLSLGNAPLPQVDFLPVKPPSVMQRTVTSRDWERLGEVSQHTGDV